VDESFYLNTVIERGKREHAIRDAPNLPKKELLRDEFG
jgi:hypothetical protein